jgi:hypothetical protein
VVAYVFVERSGEGRDELGRRPITPFAEMSRVLVGDRFSADTGCRPLPESRTDPSSTACARRKAPDRGARQDQTPIADNVLTASITKVAVTQSHRYVTIA